MQKKFVCLAHSVREGGCCIAGKEILVDDRIGNWFRPIGRTKESLPARDCTFSIGQVVTCETSEHLPSPTQPENYKIAQQPNWQTVGIFPKQYIDSLIDSPSSLWSTGFGCSSRHGTNDRASLEVASAAGNSLYFINVVDAIIKKQDESYEENLREKIRLEFSYNNEWYLLVVTYPKLSEFWWHNLAVGQSEKIGPCYLTVSLAQPYNGYCYKLVAGYVSV